MTPEEHSLVKASLEENWSEFLVLQVTDEIRERAGELAESFALRGFDSIHLASYLELARLDSPTRFSCFDKRLRLAAEQATAP